MFRETLLPLCRDISPKAQHKKPESLKFFALKPKTGHSRVTKTPVKARNCETGATPDACVAQP